MALYNPFSKSSRDINGRVHWIWYVVYILLIVLVTWASLLILLKTDVISSGTWLYDHTTWIPGLGKDSWARKSKST